MYLQLLDLWKWMIENSVNINNVFWKVLGSPNHPKKTGCKPIINNNKENVPKRPSRAAT